MSLHGRKSVPPKALLRFVAALSAAIFSCSSPAEHEAAHVPAAVAVPSVQRIPVDTVVHLKDAPGVVRYSVYIPPGLDTSSPVPVVLFADPDGDGDLPLLTYKDLAARYGMVFAGSLDSRNGRPLETNQAALTGMLTDLQRRLRTDNRLLFVAGFSGGARAASHTALQTGLFAGVLAAGAGMVQPERTTAASFHYVAMAARGDFNFTEMMSQHRFFRRTGLGNDLLVYAGHHEWPPLAVMERALELVRFSATHRGLMAPDPGAMQRYGERVEDEAGRLRQEGRLVELAGLYEQAIGAFTGTKDTLRWSMALHALSASPEMAQALSDAQRLEQREKTLIDQYVPLLAEKDAAWWGNEVKMLETRQERGSRFESESYSRIVAYLRLAAYLYCSRYLEAEDLDAAWRLTAVYATVDPDNPEAPYMQARILAQRGRAGEATPYLRRSALLGHKRRATWRNDPLFRGVDRYLLDSLASAP